jgi:predicted nucleic acid-binding protein
MRRALDPQIWNTRGRHTRKPDHPHATHLAKLIEDYLSWEIVINTPQSILAALGIEMRYKVSYWDALILHAAESCGAVVLYSEDLSHGKRYGAVEVVNPLRA